jgi:hypothetical protein
MKKLAHGTVFAVPLPDGTYICGRVLLDIYGTLKRRLFPIDSLLPGLGQAYLVEMYSAITIKPEYVPSPVLIPGAFVESKEVGNAWPIVGQQPIDPRKVEFPEALIGFRHRQGDVAFECGEISFPVPFKEKSALRKTEYFLPSGGAGISVRHTRHSAFYWPYMCLWALGRRSEIPTDWIGITFEHNDLRFCVSSHRARVYEYLPFSMEQSYFEKQAQMGLHLERLYE